MFSTFLQWDTLQKIILNTIFVSIPEEFFLVMFTLILAGEFDYWEEAEYKKLINTWDYTRVFVPTIVGAILTNIIRYCGTNFGVMSLIPPLALYFLMILTNTEVLDDHGSAKWVGKVFLFMTLGMLVIYICEFPTMTIFLYYTGKATSDISNNIFLNFIVSFPARVIEYLVLIFFVIKKRTLLRAKILMPILESRISKYLTLITVICDFVFLFIMVKTVTFDKILCNIPMDMRITIILSITLFPLIHLSVWIGGLYNVKNREVQKRKEISEEIGKVLNGLKIYTNSENYDNIKWKLNEIGINLENIADSLYESKRK